MRPFTMQILLDKENYSSLLEGEVEQAQKL